jgi:homoserine O-acetyltransferase
MLSVKSPVNNNQVPEVLHFPEPFELENGISLQGIDITYTTSGTLNRQKDNVVWVFHALTGNAEPSAWWPGLFGSGNFFDPEDYFIVCANVIGSCYGSTGPESINKFTGMPYLQHFPLITIKDMVKAHELLRKRLNIKKIKIGIGGSLGGQQLLEWSVTQPDLFDIIIPIATNAKHSAWGIAFNEAQRMALTADNTYYDGTLTGGRAGLKAARAIAMISYRTQDIYKKNQTDIEPLIDNFRASSYQQYQGEKLSQRFSPHAYYILSKAMDSHNVGRGHKSMNKALNNINSKALVVGIKTDLLFPVEEQELIANEIPKGEIQIIESIFGHDGFLVETKLLSETIKTFIEK